MRLVKKVILSQLKEWVSEMYGKPEWATVQRHLIRAMVAAEDLVRKK